MLGGPPVSARTARIGERAGELDAETTVGVDRASGGVGQVAQPATARVDGDHLAKSIRVRPERIGGGQNERARPGDIQKRARRVAAAKVRELGEIRAVPKEDLGDTVVAIPSLA